jgi:hypothetical protein
MKGKLLTFVVGFGLGIAAAILAPRYLGPLLPAGLRSESESVEGTVVRRQRDQERLLLTINTAQGAALATFTEKVAEIDLLVDEGDSVTLGLDAYEPFVENPSIRAVHKAGPAGEAVVPAASAVPEAMEPAAVEPAAGAAEPPPADAPAMDAPSSDAPSADAPAADASAAEAELGEWPAGGDDG